MKITREEPDPSAEKWKRWHILTVAETGFSMLNIYGCLQRGLDREDLRNFAEEINENDIFGTLYPRAPISVIPRRFFRDQPGSANSAVFRDLKRLIIEFVDEIAAPFGPRRFSSIFMFHHNQCSSELLKL